MAHKNTLYQLPNFWVALLIPLITAILIASWIAWRSIIVDGYTFCWSAVGINETLGMMKLPLGLSALTFPCVALVTANHRSHQAKAQLDNTELQLRKAEEQIQNTRKQIELTQSKNTFDQYYNHTEQFQKMIKGFSDRNGVQRVEVFDEMNIYRKIFNGNSPLNFTPKARPLRQYAGFGWDAENIGLIELVLGSFNRLREFPKSDVFGEKEAEMYCLALRSIARHLNIVAINYEDRRIIISENEGVNKFSVSESTIVDKIMADYIARLIDFSIDKSSGRDKLDMNLEYGGPFEAFKNNEEYMNAHF